MGLLGLCVIDEEIYRSAVLLPKSPVNVILYECNDQQAPTYLEPVIRGEKRTAFPQTEPHSGSDPGGSMQTRAVRDGDDWVINGHKFFISNSLACDFWMLQAVTDQDKRRRGGITMFLIDKGTPGINVTEIKTWHNRPFERATCEMTLDNVVVPHANILGEEGYGFRLGQRWLVAHDRLTRGASSLGQMQRSLDMSIEWARQRQSFGKPIASRQAIQWMIVDMFVDIQALRAITYGAAAKYDNGDIDGDFPLPRLPHQAALRPVGPPHPRQRPPGPRRHRRDLRAPHQPLLPQPAPRPHRRRHRRNAQNGPSPLAPRPRRHRRLNHESPPKQDEQLSARTVARGGTP